MNTAKFNANERQMPLTRSPTLVWQIISLPYKQVWNVDYLLILRTH